jgi:GAF domain-containing protein
VSWVSEPTDGPWEPATEHDDKVLGDDPATKPGMLAETIRARASRPQPVQPQPPAGSGSNIHADVTRDHTVLPNAKTDDVVLLDMVSRNAPTTHAPERTATAAGSLVVVATGIDAERIRQLCQTAQLDVPIVASLIVVHDAASVVVIGEPSPPAPPRVVHIARPTLSDDMVLALLRAFATSRVLADPPPAATSSDPRVRELAERLAAETDHAAIERIAIEAILALTDADRAQVLFHDPATGALWSESKQRASGDARRAVAGVVGWCAQTGHAVMASPAGDDPRYLLDLDDPDGKPQARVLVQPVIGGDRRVHAVLVAARRWRRTDFTDAEREMLRDFAARVAPAIDTLAIAAPRRPSRTTLPGVSTSVVASGLAAAAAGVADALSPATTMELPPPGSSTQKPIVVTSPTMRSLPPMPTRPPATEPLRAKRPSVDEARAKRPSMGEPRARRPSAEDSKRSSRDGIEPRDIAVVATDATDIGRAGKLAKKARLEVSVLSSPDEVPAYYRIVTLGEAWTPESDPRIAYAARSEITDDDLIALLAGIASERAPAPLVALKPQTLVEARRLQPAFARLRAIATDADLAAAETTMVATLTQLLDADRAYCLYFDATDGSLWSETRERTSHDDRLAIAGVVGWCARTGRSANVERASADPRYLGPLDDPEGDPNSQLLAQPVITADRRVIGVLVAVRRPKRPGFTDADVALLGQISALASPLLEQLELADDCAQLLRDSSAPIEMPAPPSPLQRLVARGAALPRWSYAVAGAAVAAALMALAS